MRATFLLDGTVRGTWKIEKSRDAASLVVEPFEPPSDGERDVLAEEGDRLVRLVEDGAEEFEIRFAE